jgi:transcriptional regulator with XRE-family HTH domain
MNTMASYKPRMRKVKSPTQFGERLRTLRIQKNLSQQEFADMFGVSAVQYGRYERGASLPAAEMLKRMTSVLGVTGDYLLNGENAGAARADFEDLDLLKLFQQVEGFPDEDKAMIKKILEAFVVKRKLQDLAAS